MNRKIVYFTSPGCSICANQAAILDQLKKEMDIEIESHLITSAFDKALTFGVKSAPAMVFLQENRPRFIKTGFQSKIQVKEVINKIEEK